MSVLVALLDMRYINITMWVSWGHTIFVSVEVLSMGCEHQIHFKTHLYTLLTNNFSHLWQTCRWPWTPWLRGKSGGPGTRPSWRARWTWVEREVCCRRSCPRAPSDRWWWWTPSRRPRCRSWNRNIQLIREL